MFDDDLEPQKQPAKQKNLEFMSVEELESYIVELTAEIERVEADITGKKSHMDAVSSVFKD